MVKKATFLFLCLLFAGVALSIFGHSRTGDRIPLPLLFGDPERAFPKISPDGTRLAFSAPREGVPNLWIRDLNSHKEFPITDDRGHGIREYFWHYDGSCLIFKRDVDGDENWNFYAVDIASQQIRKLTPFSGVRVDLLSYNPKHPNHLLVKMNKDNPELFDLYRVDLSSGALELVFKNPGQAARFYVDEDLQLQAWERFNEDGSTDIMTGDTALMHWTMSESMMGNIVSIDADTIYAIDPRGVNTARLVRIDRKTGQTEVLHENLRYDVAEVWLHPLTREPLDALVYEERLTHHPLHAKFADDLQVIERHCKGAIFSIPSASLDLEKFVVIKQSDVSPPACYLYSCASQKMEFLFDFCPRLSKYRLSPMEPIQFTARDGLVLEGYLSKSSPASPLIVMVHGGPQVRDQWEFNRAVQFFVNRGYSCLQINYRGSKGYGKALLDAGTREWGRNMQNDLTDGVEWAIQQGIVARDKVGIFGGSYGGYAALVGAALTPDVYRVAIDFVGPSNLISLLETIPPYWKIALTQFYVRVGHPELDREMLKARSPLFAASQIRIPLLIAQGANDPRVKRSESEQIVAELQKHGIPHEYILYPDEGHGFGKAHNRIDFYQRVEDFLGRYLN